VPLLAAKILVGLVLAGLTLAYSVALFAAEARIEAARRPGAPPIPRWTRGRYLHLSDPANLRPGSGPLVGRYRALWRARPVVVAGAALAGYYLLR
jgi:hypothetical protein